MPVLRDSAHTYVTENDKICISLLEILKISLSSNMYQTTFTEKDCLTILEIFQVLNLVPFVSHLQII